MEQGGWQPVFRRRHGTSGLRTREGMYTVFIDNIPDSMSPKHLFYLFTNLGIVKDVFIPSKRRKTLGSRFDFARCDCPVAAEMAIQKANRIWCDDKVLQVKKAEFGKQQAKNKDKIDTHILVPPRAVGVRMTIGASTVRRMSYAEALQGGNDSKEKAVVLKVEEYGNGWMYTSVVEKLWPKYCSAKLKEELLIRGVKDVQVKDGGGRMVYLSFPSSKERRSSMKNYRGREEEEDDVAGVEGDLALNDGALHSDKEVACKEGGMAQFVGPLHGINLGLSKPTGLDHGSSSGVEFNSISQHLLFLEAQATIQLGKELGIDFEGKDDEVMKKIIEMEEKDMEQAAEKSNGAGV
ncbi:hypothetical protein HYC85_030025 [Camellia sinensis]|uniref:RRM domain-containing protein n=1 Tax=Camellia sinensis TaxID=4442 RepID=A0A7J7G3E4_CAMSI|nr:hypothetical protein HYC85_030025 [Camellia sinensis]